MKFTALAKSITRRGLFYKHKVPDFNGHLRTWISTDADDVVITDIRDKGMIDSDQILSVLNESKKVAKLLEELNALEGSISSDKIKELIAPFV